MHVCVHSHIPGLTVPHTCTVSPETTHLKRLTYPGLLFSNFSNVDKKPKFRAAQTERWELPQEGKIWKKVTGSSEI